MLTRTLLSFVAVTGVAVAGCVTDPTEPIALQAGANCADVAAVTGLELGNQELRFDAAIGGHYELDAANPEAFALAPADWGTHAPWAPELASPASVTLTPAEWGTHAPWAPGSSNPPGVTLTPAEWGTHLEWAAELGVVAVVVDSGRVAVAHVVDPAVTGWDLNLTADRYGHRVRPFVTLCLDR